MPYGGGGFRRGGGGGGGFRRNFGPREMHKITCSECGKEDEVPFKPRKDTPVYCRECFAKKKGLPPREEKPKAEEDADDADKAESTEDKAEDESEEEAEEETADEE